MNNILCSIIIPYYNVPAELVNKCISSIINQDWGETCYEVIFINDGSIIPIAESTKQLFSKIRLFTLIEQENQGLSAARNSGIKASNGKYIFFIDPDDYWFQFSIGKLLPLLNNNSYDIIKFRSQHIFEYNNKKKHPEKTCNTYTYSSGCEYLSKHNIIKGACTYCYLRNFIISHNLFMPVGIIHEDEWFLTKVFFYANNILDTNITLYAYIKRDGSITYIKSCQQWNKSLTHFFESIKLSLDIKNNIAKSKSQISAINNRLSYIICDYIYNIFNSSLPKKDKIYHLQALKYVNLLPLPPLGNNKKYNLIRLFSINYTTLNILIKGLRFINNLRNNNRDY